MLTHVSALEQAKLIVGIHGAAALKGSCAYKNAEDGAPGRIQFIANQLHSYMYSTSKVVNMQSKFYFIIARVQ